MAKEIRIYYESIEQAKFFLEPCVKDAFGRDTVITFIEVVPPRADSVIALRLAKSLSQRNPDGIVTVILDGEEFPLVWIEFTTQVATQDHALQGFPSFIAAGLNEIPLVRIVASRISASEHGGESDYDFTQPYKLLWREYKTPSIELIWPTSTDGSTALRNPDHMACPRGDLGLVEVLKASFGGVETEGSAAAGLAAFALKQGSETAIAIARNMGETTAFVPAPRSTRFFRDSRGRWTLKFNRWGHSMDPERGMAQYYATLLGSPIVGRLHDKQADSIREALNNLRIGTGINVTVSSPEPGSVEITQDIVTSNLNRAGQIIAKYMDEFTISREDGSEIVVLKWDPKQFQDLPLKFETAPITSISSKNDLTEDDVTYVVANEVYPKNGFLIHSVSYPGAQGDFALLTGSGRAVRRKYFDVIATKHLPNGLVVALTEVKGSGVASIIASDIEVVLAWRDDSTNRANLVQRMSATGALKIHASIAYPGSTLTVSARRCSELDYVVLVEEGGWAIWAQLGKQIEGINVFNGRSNIPERHKY